MSERESAEPPPNNVRTGIIRSDDGLAAAIFGSVLSWPGGLDAPCLIDANETMTARRVMTEVASRIARLRNAGVQKHEVVLVPTGRRHKFWLDLLALWVIGAVPVPIESHPMGERASIVLQKSCPRWQLGLVDGVPVSHVPSIADELELEEHPILEDVVWDITPTDPDDVTIILFTSGTMGEPKGAALSNRAVLGNAVATGRLIGLRSTDVLGTAIPFRFVSALSHFVVSILSGTRYAGTEISFTQTEFVQYLLETGCTCYGGSPLQARWIAEWLEGNVLGQQNGQKEINLRWIMSSGDYFPEDVGFRLMQLIPDCTVVVAYGLTEAAGRMCCRVLTQGIRSGEDGAVGSAIDGLELEAFDDDMNKCSPNEIGKIFVRGKYLLRGYINDLQTTSRAFREDWFETGDYGQKTDAGIIYLRGRSDEVFKVAGVKVSSAVIASTLLATKMLADVVVVHRDHPKLGYVPHVYYVLAAGAMFDLRKVMRFLRERLPSSHLPWGFSPIDRIPRTGSGKIDRRKFRQVIESQS
jgi:long-chain acyl-CoA synthetase